MLFLKNTGEATRKLTTLITVEDIWLAMQSQNVVQCLDTKVCIQAVGQPPVQEAKILSMYGLGTSYRDIATQVEDLYGITVSTATLSAITDKIIAKVKEWQQRPLNSLYLLFTAVCPHAVGSSYDRKSYWAA
jgi:hypothetical protein